MNKLYNQLKNIVAANVVRCARTTTYKHLGSLHNPLSHGNWSKGAGMYGGKVGGGLAKEVGDRLRQRQGMSGAARQAEASPAAAGLRRAQAGKSETQNFLNRGQKSEQQNFLNRGHLNRGQKLETQNFLNRGHLNRGQKLETQNFLNRGRPARGGGYVKLGDLPRTSKPVKLGDLPRTSKPVILGDLLEGRGRDKRRTALDERLGDLLKGQGRDKRRTALDERLGGLLKGEGRDKYRTAVDFPLWRGKKGAKDEPRTAVDFPRRGQAGSGGRQTMDRPRGGGRQTMDRPRGGGRQTMDRPRAGKRLQPDFPLWRGKKGAKDEPRTAVDFPRRGQAGTGKRLQPEARDNSNARRDAIAQQISILSRGRQRQTPAERMSFQRQEYERRQKAPIVRTEDGLPRHYEWVYGKGGDRLLPMDRPKGGGRQTMEYRAPRDSRGNLIPKEDLPRIRREPYRPGKDKPEYRNMLK